MESYGHSYSFGNKLLHPALALLSCSQTHVTPHAGVIRASGCITGVAVHQALLDAHEAAVYAGLCWWHHGEQLHCLTGCNCCCAAT